MNAFHPYLNFDGNAREAMTFYHQCFGGDFMIQSFAEAHVPSPAGAEQRILHARISTGKHGVLMASDTMPGMTYTRGNDVAVSVDCETNDELEKLFGAMSQGANVTMPLADQFWGARFGMLTDKFGVHWMFNCDVKQQ